MQDFEKLLVAMHGSGVLIDAVGGQRLLTGLC